MKLEVHLKRKKPDGWKWGALCKRGFQLCTLNKKIVTLELLDLPGERMSDLALMLKNKFEKASFREWSARVKSNYKAIQGSGKYKTYEEYIDRVKELLKEFKTGQKEAKECKEEIIKAYKDFLPLVRAKRVAYYAPSTIRLTEDGLLVPADDADEFKEVLDHGFDEPKDHKLELKTKEKDLEPSLENGDEQEPRSLRNVYIGLSDAEFAPLPEEAFTDGAEELAGMFEAAYNRYYETIMAKLVEKLRNVNQVYYLVDVLNLLRDGREKMDLEKRFGSSFFKLFRKPQSTTPIISDAVDWFSELFNSVKKICLVATQADKVPLFQWKRDDKGGSRDEQGKKADETEKIKKLREKHPNMDNIKKLLESLFAVTIKNNLGVDIKKEMFVCSAIVSTVPGAPLSGQGDTLRAYWKDDGELKYKLRPPVPENWPSLDDLWKRLETYPYEMPKRCLNSVDPRVSALPQYNLADIAKSMLEL